MVQNNEHKNSVYLVGRMSGPMEVQQLPSGSEVGNFRLVVDRDGLPAVNTGRPRRSFDVIDCSVWESDARELIGDWCRGDVVELTGALRRRFWKNGEGTVSRYEVAVDGARRLVRAEGSRSAQGPD